jgi:hypothetical protein
MPGSVATPGKITSTAWVPAGSAGKLLATLAWPPWRRSDPAQSPSELHRHSYALRPATAAVIQDTLKGLAAGMPAGLIMGPLTTSGSNTSTFSGKMPPIGDIAGSRMNVD